VAYKTDGTQVSANVPRFEDGKFGKAVMVEEGTTNCIVSCDFETWASYVTDNATGTIEFRQDPVYGKVVKLKKTDDGSGRVGLRGTLSGLSGSIYTYSVYVRALSGTGRIACMYVDAAKTGGGLITSSSYRNLSDLPLGQWVRITATKDGSPDTLAGGGSVYVWVDNDNGECEFAYPQVEAKPYATSFIDGTRSPETLTIPTAGVLNPQEGTIECWVYVPEFWKQGIPNWRRIWGIGRDAGAGMYVLYYAPNTGKIHFTIWNSSGVAQTISVNKPTVGWHFFAAKWSASEMALFIDGVKVGSIANPSLPSSFADTVISIGCRPDDPYDNVNTLIDDLRISSIARSDEEIQIEA